MGHRVWVPLHYKKFGIAFLHKHSMVGVYNSCLTSRRALVGITADDCQCGLFYEQSKTEIRLIVATRCCTIIQKGVQKR